MLPNCDVVDIDPIDDEDNDEGMVDVLVVEARVVDVVVTDTGIWITLMLRSKETNRNLSLIGYFPRLVRCLRRE